MPSDEDFDSPQQNLERLELELTARGYSYFDPSTEGNNPVASEQEDSEKASGLPDSEGANLSSIPLARGGSTGSGYPQVLTRERSSADFQPEACYRNLYQECRLTYQAKLWEGQTDSETRLSDRPQSRSLSTTAHRCLVIGLIFRAAINSYETPLIL